MLYVSDSQEKARLAQELWRAGYRKARRSGLDAADADDAIQEVGLHVLLERFGDVHAKPNPPAFLVSHVGYRCLDRHREHTQRVQREVSLTRWDEGANAQDDEDRVSHRERTPAPLTVPHPVERHMELEEARERVAKVAAVVRGLSPKRRRIFGLCIVCKRPYMEVAKELGIAYSTVRTEVWKIKKLLNKAVFGAQVA
jgi:RNA polymerase sigma factor (sigma-70 family)